MGRGVRMNAACWPPQSTTICLGTVDVSANYNHGSPNQRYGHQIQCFVASSGPVNTQSPSTKCARIGLELDPELTLNTGYENQLKIHMIPQLLLKLRLVKRNLSILDCPDLRFLELESSPNSCIRLLYSILGGDRNISGPSFGLKRTDMWTLLVQSWTRTKVVQILRRTPRARARTCCKSLGVTPREGVVDPYEGYRAVGDGAQELRDTREQADSEHLERVVSERFADVCQDS